MNISITNLANGRPNNVSSFTTASITPSPGSLILVAVGNRFSSSTPNGPALSGLGLTWSVIGTVAQGSGQRNRMTLFIAEVTSPVIGVLTVSFSGQTQDDSSYSVEQITGADNRNNGLSAILQQNQGTVSGGSSQSISLSALANVNNICYAAFTNGGGGSTVGGGFTSLAIPPNLEMLTEYAVNNNSPSYTYTGSNDSAGIAVEIALSKRSGGFIL